MQSFCLWHGIAWTGEAVRLDMSFSSARSSLRAKRACPCARLHPQVFGEYLHFCYFSFYAILALTWPLAWTLCAREHFDAVSASVAGAYLLCLGSYLVLPVKGPFWTYERPDPADVGYLFSHITHAIDKSGSSHGIWIRAGTAQSFLSCHCVVGEDGIVSCVSAEWRLLALVAYQLRQAPAQCLSYWMFFLTQYPPGFCHTLAGTATPSSHCALTVASWGCALIYMLPLGLIYIAVAPALIFSTVWCGFHYGTDALLGCLVGVASIIFGHWLVQVRQYNRPKCDTRYSIGTKASGLRPNTYDLVPLWRGDDNLDESNEV